MHKIVLIRHGESVWNKKNLFTGWTDVGLTKTGELEAVQAGKELKKKKFKFDIAYTSQLKRASKTLKIVLKEMNETIETTVDWRLNERHYGDLQGLNKKQMAEKFGEEQVFAWRRSYDVRPPKISKSNKFNQKNDPNYKGIKVPDCESLKDVVDRVIPFWKEVVVPQLIINKTIIISASGNSLRALVKHLDKISDKKITELNIPNGVPIVYELDDKLRPIRHYNLFEKK